MLDKTKTAREESWSLQVQHKKNITSHKGIVDHSSPLLNIKAGWLTEE